MSRSHACACWVGGHRQQQVQGQAGAWFSPVLLLHAHWEMTQGGAEEVMGLAFGGEEQDQEKQGVGAPAAATRQLAATRLWSGGRHARRQ
eukprot:1143391-Pelagomonas_calceolata.AAC.1